MESNQSITKLEIDKLITNLSSKNSQVRQNARLTLANIGQPAIIPLWNQLRSSEKWVRWESAKALAEMREPCVAPILVNFLTDKDTDIRWMAAEGLIALGSVSLEPLFESLTQYSGSLEMAESAHHVLHDLFAGKVHEGELEYEPLNPLNNDIKSIIKPVMESIRSTESTILIPELAKVALDELNRLKNKPGKGSSESE